MENKKEWESVEPKIWSAKENGDMLEGVLISKEENKGKFGSDAYYIENKDGVHLVYSSTVLARLMKLVSIGEEVQIKFTGLEDSDKGNPTKLYEVKKRKKGGNHD